MANDFNYYCLRCDKVEQGYLPCCEACITDDGTRAHSTHEAFPVAPVHKSLLVKNSIEEVLALNTNYKEGDFINDY